LQAAAADSASLLPGMADPAMRQHMFLNRMANIKSREFIGGQAANEAFAGLADRGNALDDNYLIKQQGILGELLSQRAGVVTSMGAEHPVVKALDGNIRATRDSIALYQSKRMASLSAGVQVSRSVSTRMTDEAAESKDHMLQAVRQRLTYSQRVIEADNAGDEYEAAMADQAAIALNRDVPRADLRLLTSASLPYSAWFPDWRYYVPLSLTLGLLYAVLGCAWIEHRDRRVHTAADLVGWTGAELAGIIPKG
jgi:succinoglycan biosynthesis transport protein ExoP